MSHRAGRLLLADGQALSVSKFTSSFWTEVPSDGLMSQFFEPQSQNSLGSMHQDSKKRSVS